MFVVSADLVDLKDSYIRSTLAHEFQHMIHWHLDRNEQAWLNEGFSELATILNGYDSGGFENAYIFNPDIQLNDWPADQSQTPAHYGAGYLFAAYFLDRFGEKATQDLIKEPANGMASVDQVLTDIGAKSPIDGKAMTSVDFFQDWTIANYLADKQIYNGVYSYHNIKAPIAAQTQIEQNCGSGAWHTASVHQFGVDYIQFNCGQSSTLDFEGATGVKVMPIDPKSGQYYYWSNCGDQSDSTLQREFDLTGVGGKISLNYWTWYDIEQDYDFVYVSAYSNGVDWVQLKPALCSSDNKTGNNYGCGYTGSSDGWQADSVNLDQFVGQKVTVRFDYVTEAAVNGRGFLLDDVSLSTGGYKTDFEQADSSWQANGFVRIQNNLPQTYALALIKEKGGLTTITRVSLDEMQKGSVKLEPGARYTLVVSATEGFTNDQAGYRYATH